MSEEVPWQRLNSRLIWVNALRFAISLLPTLLSILVFGQRSNVVEIWAPYIATAAGVFVSTMDFVRWLRTRYRITEEVIEIHTGRFIHKFRSIPRDRIRTVDNKAKLRHRLAGLRVVYISPGGSGTVIRLDAVTKLMAEEIRSRLLGVAITPKDKATTEIVLARVRWYWIFYNMVNIWGLIVAAFVPLTLHGILQIVNVDLFDLIRNIVDWDSLGIWRSAALVLAALSVLSVISLTASFVKENWNFELVRIKTESDTSLLTRQGLFTTREIYREDGRIRGIHLSQPFLWRWMGLTETSVISTGLAGWSLSSSEEASTILPRAPISEAIRVAGAVLQDDSRPLECKLELHPHAALMRRVIWALAIPSGMSGLAFWLGSTGALPMAAWPLPLALIPATLTFALFAYRSLGHALVGEYLVFRCGLSRQTTVALQRRGIIGWKLRQSIFQRCTRMIDVGVSTAAGEGFYHSPDFGYTQAIAFSVDATPMLIAQFLDHEADPWRDSKGHPTKRLVG